MTPRKWTTADGVLSVELPPPNSSLRARLKTAVQEATSLRASVAYWTVPYSWVAKALPDVTAAPPGFVCVDLHLPTDIDRLNALKKAGGDVHLYVNRPAPSARHLWGKRGPRHLLHSKCLLFDRARGPAMLWIGSHNWTKPALAGVNVEASAILEVEPGSPIYREAVGFLERSRGLCEPFDPDQVDYYKALQGGDEGDWVAEVEGHNVGDLVGQSVLLFATQKVPLAQVPSRGIGVVLSAHDSDTGELHVYRGQVLRSGVLGATNAGASVANWGAVRHTFQVVGDLPRLELASVPEAALSSTAFASVLVALEKQEPAGTEVEEVSHLAKWVASPHDPIEDLAPPTELAELKGKRRTALIQMPNPERRHQGRRRTLEDKRREGTRGLFERKRVEPPQ